jgi:hypothetical protein
MPKRIQLRRTKGWRKPADAVVVSRPSRWGNPITPDNTIGCETKLDAAEMYRALMEYGETVPYPHPGQSWELDRYREWVLDNWQELQGRDLACWCPLDQPCHADVLLEIANGEAA